MDTTMTNATATGIPGLFYRDGSPFCGARAEFIRSGVYSTKFQARCSRCGGAGGAEQWRHTGWTCYECAGSGQGKIKTVKLYTADKLAKLDATKAKADAKRAAKKAAAAAEREREAACRRSLFLAEHAELLNRARPFLAADATLRDVVERGERDARLTINQIELIAMLCGRAEAAAAEREASNWIGAVGERIEVAVTVARIASFERAPFRGGYLGGTETVWVVTMKDAAGNVIVSKSPAFKPEQGASFTLRATVQVHDEYRGTKQTTVKRATEKEARQ